MKKFAGHMPKFHLPRKLKHTFNQALSHADGYKNVSLFFRKYVHENKGIRENFKKAIKATKGAFKNKVNKKHGKILILMPYFLQLTVWDIFLNKVIIPKCRPGQSLEWDEFLHILLMQRNFQK